MNAIICLVCLFLAGLCFYQGIKKGYFGVYISLMAGGLRPELLLPTFLIGIGSYLIYQAYVYFPFMIIWK
jgi:hypothetical protein